MNMCNGGISDKWYKRFKKMNGKKKIDKLFGV